MHFIGPPSVQGTNLINFTNLVKMYSRRHGKCITAAEIRRQGTITYSVPN